jgi:hypothetical protein
MSFCCFSKYKKISIIPDTSNDFLNKTLHGENIYEKKQLINDDSPQCSMIFLLSFFDSFCCKPLKKNVTFHNDYTIEDV